LLDPTSEDVTPVVRELQRRLSNIDTNQGDDVQDNSPLEIEVDEDDGMLDHNYTFLFIYLRIVYNYIQLDVWFLLFMSMNLLQLQHHNALVEI
jgi:hypothetical protein